MRDVATDGPRDGEELVAAGARSDGDLLDRFVRERDEAAFAVLVARHGGMVWGVCRRVVRDHHAAEDAFQAVFLVLARRAHVVRPRDRVGPWLHGVAHRTALRARGAEARLQVRASLAPDLSDQPDRSGGAALDTATDPIADLLPRLDREVERLPSKYRLPVVLCELEGLSYREAADQLGWPVGTVSGRLSRARAILAGRLTRPEVAHLGLAALRLPAVGVVAPPRLASATARLARLVALGGWTGAEVGSAPSLDLMRGVLTTMRIARIRLAALTLASFALAAGGAGLTLRALAAPEPATRPQGQAPPQQQQQQPAPKAAQAKPQGKAAPADPMPAYSFRFDAENVREFPELAIKTSDLAWGSFGSVEIRTGPATVVPIVTEVGTTGLVILGRGTYRFALDDKRAVAGSFQPLAMLRFNPSELARILDLNRGKKVTDKGAVEACLIATPPLVRHCWQSNRRTETGERKQELLIPPADATAAVLLTENHGDLLLSVGKPKQIAHSFTERQTLFEEEAKPGFQ